jgi:hypothetical protein
MIMNEVDYTSRTVSERYTDRMWLAVHEPKLICVRRTENDLVDRINELVEPYEGTVWYVKTYCVRRTVWDELYETKLYETKLYETKLYETKLYETKLYETKLYETKLYETKLYETKLSETNCIRRTVWDELISGSVFVRRKTRKACV